MYLPCSSPPSGLKVAVLVVIIRITALPCKFEDPDLKIAICCPFLSPAASSLVVQAHARPSSVRNDGRNTEFLQGSESGAGKGKVPRLLRPLIARMLLAQFMHGTQNSRKKTVPKKSVPSKLQ
ncbi:hypothetical protein EDD18DRAFT_1106817 [Armillaria luteobubalina]|uniref:Uncharacterized protein n=1 Tax=Armillaria luteobubalina TaxID=153913 RepID=A0AA39Q4C9_9AGAR|nr:hypothetical protein EDD18DRAFT_1106817 [Armillaria luteobubalina]